MHHNDQVSSYQRTAYCFLLAQLNAPSTGEDDLRMEGFVLCTWDKINDLFIVGMLFFQKI